MMLVRETPPHGGLVRARGGWIRGAAAGAAAAASRARPEPPHRRRGLSARRWAGQRLWPAAPRHHRRTPSEHRGRQQRRADSVRQRRSRLRVRGRRLCRLRRRARAERARAERGVRSAARGRRARTHAAPSRGAGRNHERARSARPPGRARSAGQRDRADRRDRPQGVRHQARGHPHRSAAVRRCGAPPRGGATRCDVRHGHLSRRGGQDGGSGGSAVDAAHRITNRQAPARIPVLPRGGDPARRLSRHDRGGAHHRRRQPPRLPPRSRRRAGLSADAPLLRRAADAVVVTERLAAHGPGSSASHADSAARRRGALLPRARAAAMSRFRIFSARAIDVWLAVGVCSSVLVLIGFGYLATREWKRSSALVVERRENQAADLLLTALTRDMQAVQRSVLSSAEWDVSTLDSPYDLANIVASAFARYPYPEAFFADRGALKVARTMFFTRSNRPPPWAPADSGSSRFPVSVQTGAPIAQQIVNRIASDAATGRRFSIFDIDADGTRYQVVARLIYRDQ